MTNTSAAPRGLAPDPFEKVLAAGAIVLFALVAVALFKGRAEFAGTNPVVWPHLATVLLALAITPYQLLRPRGDGVHRGLGWIWAILMFATAAASFAIRGPGGSFSVIHILSVVTVVTVPLMVLAARRHRVARHRRTARILITAALLIAGYFTLIPSRMLGMWLWS